MDNTLKKLKEVHSSCLIIILYKDNFRIYNEDAKIIEYNSNLISKKDVLVCNNKYLDSIKKILKKNKINYVILDRGRNYNIYDYYYSDLNKYDIYLKRSKIFNSIRRIFIFFNNLIFGIPFNRYK